MDLAGLAEVVGPERLERACAAAWETAAGIGKGLGRDDEWPHDLADIPHELADEVEGDLPLAFALYRAMPCYGNLMYIGFWAPKQNGEGFWAEVRNLLDNPDDRLAAPMAYWLWSGPFEGSDSESDAAWQRLIQDAGDTRLTRLLDTSGPVPWATKAPTLEALCRKPAWHARVRIALRWAAYDIFGRIDVPAARQLLRRAGCSDDADLLARLDELEVQQRESNDKSNKQGKIKRKKQSKRQGRRPRKG